MDDETEQSWAAFERRRFLAFTAAAAMFGLSGCAGDKKQKKTVSPGAMMVTGTSHVEKRIKKHVDDKKRRAAALAMLDKAREQIKLFGTLIDDSRDARALLPPERQTREELLAVIVEYDAKIRQNLVDACDLCVELRTVITEPEWALVFPDPKSDPKAKKRAA